ncbi:MAG: hypothetical protein LBJ00_12760 [Planctomycetaceae bacterium]|jgi:hypothetical protein|nr:hypothetical protein [Planctomycetaceae bacterium]
MMVLLGFALFCLAVTGMTLVLVQGTIFEPFRVFLANGVESIEQKREESNAPRRFTIAEFLHKVTQCLQCAGFWCGLFCGLFVLASDILYSGYVFVGGVVTLGVFLLVVFRWVMLLFCCGAAGSFLAPLGDLLLQWIYVSKELTAKQLSSENNHTTEHQNHQHDQNV